MKKFMKWYYGKASIRKKLVISYLILVLLPIGVLGVFSYSTATKNLLKQTRDAISGNVSSIAYNLQSNIAREEDNLKYLSYNVSFREKLETGSKDRTSLARTMNQLVEPAYWYFITSDRNIKGIEIYTPHIKSELGSFLKPDTQCRKEDWYQYHQENFKARWNYEDDRIFVTRTILDGATSSRPIGVMKLQVFSDRFVDPVYQSEYLKNGMLLLDEKGQKLAYRPLEDRKLDRQVQADMETFSKVGMYETDSYLLQAAEPFDNGWRLFYYVDKKEIAGDMNKILNTTLLVTGCCLMVVTFLISIISKILSTRILKLKNCAEQVAQGDFQIVTEKGYTDEIGVVAKSFETMSRKINEMMKEMYRLGLEKRATELKALQAMINPHFLYNCLSSIKWKAIRAEQDNIADITGLLAKFYRTTLNEGKQITIVQNELENVKVYLEIQSRMHEGSFEIEYRILKEELERNMPNFLLQPIVENAICHGVDFCEEGERGKITLEYYPEGEYLIFNVYNNGPRLKDEELQRILSEPGKGYGIFNIRERISMYYDSDCGVTARVLEDGRICFTVRILKIMSVF